MWYRGMWTYNVIAREMKSFRWQQLIAKSINRMYLIISRDRFHAASNDESSESTEANRRRSDCWWFLIQLQCIEGEYILICQIRSIRLVRYFLNNSKYEFSTSLKSNIVQIQICILLSREDGENSLKRNKTSLDMHFIVCWRWI